MIILIDAYDNVSIWIYWFPHKLPYLLPYTNTHFGDIVKITYAVIPVAGLGTSVLPYSKEIPKEMLL